MGETATQTTTDEKPLPVGDGDATVDSNKAAGAAGGGAPDGEVHEDAVIWDELEAAEAGAASEDLKATPPGDDQGGAGGAKDAATEGDSTAKGTATAGADKATAAGGSGATASGSDKGPDIWANATPEQKAAFTAAQAALARLEQAERSNRGRVSALQRKLDVKNPAAAKAAGGEQDADANEVLESADFKKFREEYPEVAGPLANAIGKLTATVTNQGKVLSAIGNDRRQTALDEQKTLLQTQHPDWVDVTADPGFLPWLEGQPRHIQEAAMRNADDIVDAREAADVVGRYKQVQAAKTTNTQQPNKGAGTNNPLDAKRQRQLESAASSKSGAAGVATGIPADGDPETIWKQFDAVEAKQQRRA